MFSYVNDRRKFKHELYQNFCSRKAEIGENFYFMTGERMTLIKNTIRYWRNWNDSRSDSSLSYLKKEMAELIDNMEELNAENWKYNLAGLYFSISFTHRDIIQANAVSPQQYLRVLDVGDRLNKCPDENREPLYQAYAQAIFDMCSHYEQIYARMEHDMNLVKEELKAGYAMN